MYEPAAVTTTTQRMVVIAASTSQFSHVYPGLVAKWIMEAIVKPAVVGKSSTHGRVQFLREDIALGEYKTPSQEFSRGRAMARAASSAGSRKHPQQHIGKNRSTVAITVNVAAAAAPSAHSSSRFVQSGVAIRCPF